MNNLDHNTNAGEGSESSTGISEQPEAPHRSELLSHAGSSMPDERAAAELPPAPVTRKDSDRKPGLDNANCCSSGVDSSRRCCSSSLQPCSENLPQTTSDSIVQSVPTKVWAVEGQRDSLDGSCSQAQRRRLQWTAESGRHQTNTHQRWKRARGLYSINRNKTAETGRGVWGVSSINPVVRGHPAEVGRATTLWSCE